MKYTKTFLEINKLDNNIAGGKGSSLGEMTNLGMPIPSGFVILSSAFDVFINRSDILESINKLIDSIDYNVFSTIDLASVEIKKIIQQVEIPEEIIKEIDFNFKKLNLDFVAVRSSSTAEDGLENAWAGQLESFLNVNENTLFENIKNCWTSLFSARAIFYRFEKELHPTKISTAVVIQKMINSEKSGIAFSVHPVNKNRNQIIIEAGFGLGEAVVSGLVTPDSYVVSKEPFDIIDINISDKSRAMYCKKCGGNEWRDISEKNNNQVLSKEEIYELSKIVIDIENYYNFPCDIEWAFENRNFFVLQARPITTIYDI